MKVRSNVDLQEPLIALIRAFGLHQPDRTPCGQPVAVAEAHALMELSSVQSLSQKKLAERLGLEKSTVSRLLRILEDRGWLERTRNDSDRRMIQLALTKRGLQIAQELAAARRAKFDRVVEAIPEAKRTGVIESIQVLVEAIRESQQCY